MASDAKNPPSFLAEDNFHFLGSKPLATSRYTSPQFHAAEVEKMWPNIFIQKHYYKIIELDTGLSVKRRF